jgi:uncharacterized protein YjbI with pentapeptide repeats
VAPLAVYELSPRILAFQEPNATYLKVVPMSVNYPSILLSGAGTLEEATHFEQRFTDPEKTTFQLFSDSKQVNFDYSYFIVGRGPGRPVFFQLQPVLEFAAVLRSKDARGLDLPNVNFSTMRIFGINFSGTRFDGSIFTGADLRGSIFWGVDFSNSDLRETTFDSDPMFSREPADGARTVFRNARINSATLGKNWAYLDLQDAIIDGLTPQTDLTHLKAQNTNLTHLNLSGLNLAHADFSGAILNGTNFSQATLTGANFTGAQGGPKL